MKPENEMLLNYLNTTTSVAVTGTRIGASKAQLGIFRLLVKFILPKEMHFGDCVGVDKETHELVRRLFPKITRKGHPPIKDVLRAFCEYDEELPKKDYLARDRDMVDAAQLTLALPSSKFRKPRSGTWYTIEYTVKAGKLAILIHTNGEMEWAYDLEKFMPRSKQ